MTIDELKTLHNGDDVYWEDPDGGLCSRVVTIGDLQLVGDMVRIREPSGDVLECFAHELW